MKAPKPTLIDLLTPAARASVKFRARPRTLATYKKQLRPGEDTPLWNHLADRVRPLLRGPGRKAELARFLGVSRRQVNYYFSDERNMPTAELTLLLVEWVAAQHALGNR